MKDQGSKPRHHTPRSAALPPAALPAKVKQWVELHLVLRGWWALWHH